MSENKMEEVLYDMQLAKGIIDVRRDRFYTDEQQRILIEGVFKKHGITQAILDSSLIWYADHMEEMVKINDSVVARLRRTQSLLEKQHEYELSLLSASKQKSPFASYIFLSPQEPLYSFSLDSANLAKINIAELDTVRWKILGYSRDKITVSSAVHFIYTDTMVVDSGINRTEYVAVVPVLSGKTLKNISGYVRVQSHRADFDVLVYDIRFQSDSISNQRKPVNVDPPVQLDNPASGEQKPALTTARDTLKPVRPNILRRTPDNLRMRRRPLERKK